MKFQHLIVFLIAIFLGFPSVICAEEGDEGPYLTFPPFAKEDMKPSVQPHLSNLSYDELKAVSAEELRGIMTNGGYVDRQAAVGELMERGDQKTILRLVYSSKQGNVMAMQTLNGASLAVVPYLMEDVAHGSLAYYGSYSFGDGFASDGWMRDLAVSRVGAILANAPEFTGETRDCLRAIAINESLVRTLSEESRYLTQWWLLNGRAFESGQWKDIRPLSEEISYPRPKDDTRLSRDEGWDPKNQPPYGSPLWELPESFEKWSERIVDPKRRNYDFVALSWDGKKVIEHPAVSLDPKSPSSSSLVREPRRNSPASQPVAGIMTGRGALWLAISAAFLLLSSIIWLKRKTE